MSLRAGRVGVAPDQVDDQGKIKNSGGDSYTKAETDELLAAKANKSYLTANNKIFNFAYDSSTGKYGYKAGAQGEFHPFDDAGVVGMNLPEATMTGVILSSDLELIEGGYQIVSGSDNRQFMWFDMTVYRKSAGNDTITMPEGVRTDVAAHIHCTSNDLQTARDFAGQMNYGKISTTRVISPNMGSGSYARIIGAVKFTPTA